MGTGRADDIYNDFTIDENDGSVYLISPEDFDDTYTSPINFKVRIFESNLSNYLLSNYFRLDYKNVK